MDRTIAVFEVRDEIGLGQVSGQAFNRISEGQHMDAVAIGNVGACVHRDHVS